jgi:hypothetical protein
LWYVEAGFHFGICWMDGSGRFNGSLGRTSYLCETAWARDKARLPFNERRRAYREIRIALPSPQSGNYQPAIHSAGVPMSLLDQALCHKRTLQKRYRFTTPPASRNRPSS